MPEPITFADDDRLAEWGYGITNIVSRPTPGMDGLEPAEFIEGRIRLRRKILRYRPRVVAFVGVTVFRAMFPSEKGPISLGPRPERIGDSAVFLLPNPSGRNANFSFDEMLTAYTGLRRCMQRIRR